MAASYKDFSSLFASPQTPPPAGRGLKYEEISFININISGIVKGNDWRFEVIIPRSHGSGGQEGVRQNSFENERE